MFNVPIQLEFHFEDTPYPKDYERGLESGTNWDANWMPGGPLVYSRRRSKLRVESEGRYRAWHSGFNKGLRIRLQDESFARWWETHRNGPHRRYSFEKGL